MLIIDIAVLTLLVYCALLFSWNACRLHVIEGKVREAKQLLNCTQQRLDQEGCHS